MENKYIQYMYINIVNVINCQFCRTVFLSILNYIKYPKLWSKCYSQITKCFLNRFKNSVYVKCVNLASNKLLVCTDRHFEQAWRPTCSHASAAPDEKLQMKKTSDEKLNFSKLQVNFNLIKNYFSLNS